MKLFDLLFELVRLHVPMKREDWAQMKQECEADTREWTTESPNKMKAMYAKYNDQWWFRLGVAVAFIPLTRAIAQYMNPIQDASEEAEF